MSENRDLSVVSRSKPGQQPLSPSLPPQKRSPSRPAFFEAGDEDNHQVEDLPPVDVLADIEIAERGSQIAHLEDLPPVAESESRVEFGEQDRQQIRRILAEGNARQAAVAEQAEHIQQVLRDAAAGKQTSHEVIDLPPICVSNIAGWPGYPNEAHRPASLDDGTNRQRTASETALAGTPSLAGAEFGIKRELLSQVPVQALDIPLSESEAVELPRGFPKMFNPHAQASARSLLLAKSLNAEQADGKAHGQSAEQLAGQDPHWEVFSRDEYPSAVECRKCHEQVYDEWSSSSHAYASISPMFQKFEQKISDLTQGTIGYFCMRCHAPVATTQGLRRDQPIWAGPQVFREGVTCVACHRVAREYSKVNGQRRMEPGDIYAPVYGGSDDTALQQVINNADHFKVKTDPNDKGIGQPIHLRAIKFEQLSESTFCVSCHQVQVDPGIKLEVVWDQYRASPAYREGTSCQDCHMGQIPGVKSGYAAGPGAIVNGLAVNPHRKHSHHGFYGPGYSIAHPGLFPQNPKAERWTVNDWLQFDWRAGWGTDEFEERLTRGESAYQFPPVWDNADDRYDAREIINANLKKLSEKTGLRNQVMENGSKIDGPFFSNPQRAGEPLNFFYRVTNINRGHNMPSGSLGAQPQLWLNVVLVGPDGQRIWESGFQDSQGDLADIHSEDVLNRRIPLDRQLFNLQTKFLITNVKGTDREYPLPINIDIDQLPFIRPGAQPISVINHPPFIRMEGHSIAPLGSREAKYRVPAELISQPGIYRLSVRMRSRAEPIYFMKYCDATAEMIRSMNEGVLDVHRYSVAFEVK